MLPERSRGGAALAVEPWQEEQFTPKSPLPAFEWHLLQVTAETVAGGVRAWHFVQAAVPVAAAAPWKLALLRSSQPDGWPAKPSPTPFTWRPPPASIEPSGLTVSGWQALQVARVNPAASSGWFAGGRPWQVPQEACVPSTFVQRGAMLVPPVSVAPWQ